MRRQLQLETASKLANPTLCKPPTKERSRLTNWRRKRALPREKLPSPATGTMLSQEIAAGEDAGAVAEDGGTAATAALIERIDRIEVKSRQNGLLALPRVLLHVRRGRLRATSRSCCRESRFPNTNATSIHLYRNRSIPNPLSKFPPNLANSRVRPLRRRFLKMSRFLQPPKPCLSLCTSSTKKCIARMSRSNRLPRPHRGISNSAVKSR